MALTILNKIRRFSWAFIASAGLHVSLFVGLLYTTVSSISLPSAVEQPMTVMLVAPEPQQAPPVEQPPQPQLVQPELQPVPEPEPPAPVQVLKPAPKSKPKRHREIKPQPPKPVTRPAAPAFTAPASSSVKSESNTLRAIQRTSPIYPRRAKALGIDGSVSVMFDVNAKGRVENLRVLSAQPRNMFERDIRLAMRRWIYEPGKPATNLTVSFKFDLEGVSSGE